MAHIALHPISTNRRGSSSRSSQVPSEDTCQCGKNTAKHLDKKDICAARDQGHGNLSTKPAKKGDYHGSMTESDLWFLS